MRRRDEILEQEEVEAPVQSKSTIKYIRYLLLLVMVMVALILLFTNREQINGDNFRRLMAKINIGVSSVATEDGYLRFNSGETVVYKDGFANASVEKLLITDKNGTEFQNTPLGYRTPCIYANERHVLVYDSDGSGLMVADSFSVLFDKQMEDPIITARMNDNGYLVVVTEGDGFLAKVYVYDSSFKEIYRYRSLNRYILDAAVTEDNKSLALSAMNIEGNEIKPEILYFRLDKEKVQWSVAFEEMPCIRIVTKDNGTICGLFSWGMVSLNKKGKEIGRYSFDNQVLQCYSLDDDSRNIFVVSASKNGDANVVICNEKGKVKDSFSLDYYGIDVDYHEGRTAVLGNMKCGVYNSFGKKIWEDTPESAEEISFMGRGAVVVVSDTDCVYNGIK